MKNVAILCLIFFTYSMTNLLSGQNSSEKEISPKNTVFFELAGTGLLYSLNYERIFLPSKIVSPSIRIGLTPCFARTHNRSGAGGQLFGLVNFLIGKKNLKFEIGLGINNHFNFRPSVTAGYYRTGLLNPINEKPGVVNPPYLTDITSQVSFRHQMLKHKWFYRVTFICSDFLMWDGYGHREHKFWPWGGLSLGKMF